MSKGLGGQFGQPKRRLSGREPLCVFFQASYIQMPIKVEKTRKQAQLQGLVGMWVVVMLVVVVAVWGVLQP